MLNWKELFGNEHDTNPPLSPVGHFKFDRDQQTLSRFILYNRFSYYARFLRKWEQTIHNDRQSAILNIISTKFFIMVLCESLHFVLYAWCSYFRLFLSYVNITELLKFKMNAKRPFWNRLLPESIRLTLLCIFAKLKDLLEIFSWNAPASISL